MNNILGLMIECLVAILLLVTIGYCAQLNARLKKLRADEGAMKANVAELMAATMNAERAIAGLKQTVRECDETLGERLRTAERFGSDIAINLANGRTILERLVKVVGAGRSTGLLPDEPAARPAPDVKALSAAATAFADRARSRFNGIAA